MHTVVITLGLLLLYFCVPLNQKDDPLPLPIATAISVLLAVGLAVMVARRILRVLDGTLHADLPSLVVVLVLVVVAFSGAYFVMERSDPGQVAGLATRLDSFYFTLTTMITVGYGDVHPAGQAARGVASLQMVFNAVFVVGLVRAMFYQAQVERSHRH